MQDHEKLSQILRPKQAAAELGISMATYYRLVKKGKLKHLKISDRTSGTTRGSINALLEGNAK